MQWWQSAVVYQVYPRSFADGNADGVGDLPGLTARLDHLRWLGVDALWLSPVYRSPMADFGYDVSDHCDVDPLFGTLADMDLLLDIAHAAGLKVLLDWVPNHTSDQHPWFQESRRGPDSPKANWYVWRDRPVNNWMASFPRGEPAWAYDEMRQQFYLRCFLASQPDLNWDEPAVEAAMHDTLRFWLDRGVDGFRMDVVHLIGKDLGRQDPAPPGRTPLPHLLYNDVPVTHERLRRIRALLDGYPGERVAVGEVYLLDEAAMATYYGDGDELHLNFNFRFLWSPFEAGALRQRIDTTLRELVPRGAWPTWALSNHDVPRHRGRFGGGEATARQAATLLLTLPGTPFLYQGEELGLVDAVVPLEQQVDADHRDGCRAPIPWEAGPRHGWPAEPWLPFPPDAGTLHVAAQRADPTSMLHWYRTLLDVRRATPDLHTLDFEWLDLADGVLAYRRGEATVVALNLADSPATLGAGLKVLCGTHATSGLLVGTIAPRAALVGTWA